MNKKVDKVRAKRKLQLVIPKQQQEASKANMTPGASSSCVRKIRNVQGEKTWSAQMFPDAELPRGQRGTTHNTSSSAVSSGAIKIGQLFENKDDLKMKLHIYTMKKKLKSK